VAWGRRDLASRFGAAACHAISEPDDTDKRRLLGQLARARGLEIPGPVAAYLLTHGRRGVGDLVAAVNRIDRATLAERRRVTVPFVKQVLGL
jgi:DnaA family protein